ncbi:DUF6892 domain-containing protein [Sinomicrobium sp. M5D2P9]
MITLRLSSDLFQINTISVEFPIPIEHLRSIIGSDHSAFKAKNHTLCTWNELGIIAYSKDGEMVEALSLELELQSYTFSPKKTFTGKFFFDDEEITSYYNAHKDKRVKLFNGDSSGALVLNNISAWFDTNETNIRAIEVRTYKAYFRGEGIPKDKYSIEKPEEEEITFVDFGFKLSVIQELMYNKELIKPKFDLHEFVKWYPKREIDLEEEGYEPIEEVTRYFKELPIPKRLATAVTEIYQDGGNDIYLNLVCFAEGWEDYWDIESSEDAKNFPNLKKATLCYAKESIVDEFNKIGIDAQWL